MVHHTGAVRLYLVRHGEVEDNRRLAFVGHTDPALTARGHKQAEDLQAVFTGLEIERVISSPLGRCRQTAEAIAVVLSTSVEIDDRAIEQRFGEWEGLDRRQIDGGDVAGAARFREWQRDPTTAPPSGERLQDVQIRILALVDELVDSGAKSAVVVSHVGPIKALICAALGTPLASVARFFLDPASISIIDWAVEPVVRAVNVQGVDRWQLSRWKLVR